MALHSKKLRYKRGGTEYTVDLYTTTAEVGSEYFAVRDGVTTVYAKIAPTGTANESYLRVRKSGVTKSILSALASLYKFSLDNDVLNAPSRAIYATLANSGTRAIGALTVSPYTYRLEWDGANNRYSYVNSGVDIAPGVSPGRMGLSSDGNFLAIPMTASPYVVTYKWSSTNNIYEKTAAPSPSIPAPSYGGQGANSCQLTPDGSVLVIGHYGAYASPANHLLVYKWSSVNNRYEGTANADIQSPDSCYFACANWPNYNKCAVPHQDNSGTNKFVYTYTWDSSNNRYKKDIDIDISPTTHGCAAYLTPDGSRLVVGTYSDFCSYIWSSTNSRYEKTAAPSPPCYAWSIAGHNNGEYLAIGCPTAPYSTKIYKWNSTNNRYEYLSDAVEGGNPPTHVINPFNNGANKLIIGYDSTSAPYIKTYTFNG